MNKVICEICGTSYSETADSCPICGYARDLDLMDMSQEFVDEEFEILTSDRGSTVKNTGIPHKHREIFDFDEVNADEEDEEDVYGDDDDTEEDEEPRANTAVVIVLVIIIVLLLMATGFLFFKFFLPNLLATDHTPPTESTAATEMVTEAPTEATVPCTGIAVTGKNVLVKEGNQGILHVTLIPEDTTDTLQFISQDESVVTVSDEGTITAVGEGNTSVLIVCGKQSFSFQVTVDYSQAAEETTEPQALPGLEVSESTEPVEAVSEETEETEQTEAIQVTEETQAPGGVVLKLKDHDISFTRWGVTYDLRLDCDLKPEDITWTTMNSSVVVVNNGTITVVGNGTTRVVATYEGQTAECIVRCSFH